MSTIKLGVFALAVISTSLLAPCLALSQLGPVSEHCASLRHEAGASGAELRASRLATRLQRNCARAAQLVPSLACAPAHAYQA